ncbi:DUF4301 family protein [Marinilabiliaceae bacterium ANBcel2]|nr:DUF4301 family protein [Marinilabiliaceae bacterium ANBcel2]
MINNKDIEQFNKKGIKQEEIEEQIARFKNGFPALTIARPATINDGIKPIDSKDSEKYATVYKTALNNGLKTSKFVPASGAATRMFKDLYTFLSNQESIKKLPVDSPIVKSIELLPRFAFFPYLSSILKKYNLNNVHVRKSRANEIIEKIVYKEGLNYGNLPKGLIHFHLYKDDIRTAMEEHLTEASYYAVNSDNMVNIHFTVSPEHHQLFSQKLYEKGPTLENRFDTGLDVSFSYQKDRTDTIAVDPNNNPFRDEDGNILFRPGGHGALLENLNEQDAELIFIKNIDNVVPENNLELTVKYKKALAGMLLIIKEKVFELIEQLEFMADKNIVNKAEEFISKELFIKLPNSYFKSTIEEKINYLKNFLNRPIRVCGMVKNEGEPGGGPFIIKESNSLETLQILETSQIDINNPDQADKLKQATHFNPVDLVCYTHNYKGEKFDLTKFKDPETGFISEKSYNGKPLKAIELPGLWNGAMANWITLFAEVPIETFNPVKTVNDLLRPTHQSQ